MKNKTILITGGTTGIGLATAQLLIAEGARIIVTGRNPDTLASARKLLAGATVVSSDAGDLSAALALGEEVKKYAAQLDGVFLNAGVALFAPFEAASPQSFEDMFNINVRGLFFQLQSVLPLLGNPSSVVVTSSIAASIAEPGASIYSATKAAVSSFGRTLAVELAARGIRVNVLSPGPIDTPIFNKIGFPAEQVAGFKQAMSSKSLVGRLGTSEEVAESARFLLSPASSNITGTELIVDGGFVWSDQTSV